MKKLKMNIQIILIVVLLIGLVAASFGAIIMKVQVEALNGKVFTQEKLIKKYKEKLKLDDCDDNQNTMLKRDMEIYIKKRYTKTPTVIAKAVAKNIIFFSKKYDLPPELVLGIIEIESMFNPLTESSKGAKGLMQVMPEWAPKLELKNVNDLHEIDIGIESGIRVFLIHLDEAKGSISGGLYRYVNKDHSYVERVYSAVGRFVTYRTTIDSTDRIAEEDTNDSTDKRAELHNEGTSEPDV